VTALTAPVAGCHPFAARRIETQPTSVSEHRLLGVDARGGIVRGRDARSIGVPQVPVQLPPAPPDAVNAKIHFDLSEFNDDGLYG
jgi:hypothetical protein